MLLLGVRCRAVLAAYRLPIAEVCERTPCIYLRHKQKYFTRTTCVFEFDRSVTTKNILEV